ncbi:MAG: MaoC/PaaZ C-terminal domain-containing protein [Candidatus Sulfotelmatobacter sp.]|jgi:acyl dehydratase
MTNPADSALSGDEVAADIVGRRRISHWFEVTQKQIDAFSEATHDHQWIHQATVDEEHSHFGGPIAHGLLLVSIALNLAQEGSALPEGAWVLYGFDKLRFRAPVRSGTHIRCLTIILGSQEFGGRLLLNVRLAVETEERSAPALTADCSLMCLSKLDRARGINTNSFVTLSS